MCSNPPIMHMVGEDIYRQQRRRWAANMPARMWCDLSKTGVDIQLVCYAHGVYTFPADRYLPFTPLDLNSPKPCRKRNVTLHSQWHGWWKRVVHFSLPFCGWECLEEFKMSLYSKAGRPVTIMLSSAALACMEEQIHSWGVRTHIPACVQNSCTFLSSFCV